MGCFPAFRWSTPCASLDRSRQRANSSNDLSTSEARVPHSEIEKTPLPTPPALRARYPSEIHLGTSGIRLAKPGGPGGAEDLAVPDVVGKSRAAARIAAEAAGLIFIAGDDDGSVESQSPPWVCRWEGERPVGRH